MFSVQVETRRFVLGTEMLRSWVTLGRTFTTMNLDTLSVSALNVKVTRSPPTEESYQLQLVVKTI